MAMRFSAERKPRVLRLTTETPGLRVSSDLIREPYGRTVAQLEKRNNPPEPAPDAPFAERMRRRTATSGGGRVTRDPAKPVAPRTGARLAARKPAQTGFSGVAAWLRPLENPFALLLSRLRFPLTATHFSAVFKARRTAGHAA
jgi:hypothetical protein